ncbi:glycosyltransferase involved in cell wall biosynthesis [Thermosipho japonicus]|uniref:Glycosyltransferase involved in cell wall biosynthesis n=1 Tax=Thermosipho japonicus TaxID=90323 RepID=A0A841GSX7_9BACT|nr:glycosyltransferase [Thermosipho japonicus]MBB6062808.1 glycosyltransferase involved in cell wall biosynthesis [Thermosipho japonicus]
MKVMHYFLGFPPLHRGGLMVYVKDLSFNLKEKGIDISLLMPGKYSLYSKRSYVNLYKQVNGIPVYYIKNPLPVSFNGFKEPEYFMEKRVKNNYFDFFKNINIDILHIHSLIGLPYEIVENAKKAGIKVIYTTHDYYGLCPKINFYRIDGVDCLEDYSIKNCIFCNSQTSSVIKKIFFRNFLHFKYINVLKSLYYPIKKVKMFFKKSYENSVRDVFVSILDTSKFDRNIAKYVDWQNYEKDIIEEFDYIIFNSNNTKEVYSKFIDLKFKSYEVINVSNNSIKDNRNLFNYRPLINGKVIFSFLGGKSKIKGFYSLINVFNEIRKKYNNWELHVYGTNEKLEINNENIKFKGTYTHEDLMNIMLNSSIVLLPSKSHETFGFVGLEGISYGIPVLISDKVGLKDIIIHNYNGFIVKDTKDDKYLKDQIIRILENPNILENIHNNILKMNFNFDMATHVDRILNVYKKLLEV